MTPTINALVLLGLAILICTGRVCYVLGMAKGFALAERLWRNRAEKYWKQQ